MSQEKTPRSESQLLLYGCQMSRLLQDHHGVQSRSDCSAVCRLLHSALPAYRRESSPYRRMLIQEKTALVGPDVVGLSLGGE